MKTIYALRNTLDDAYFYVGASKNIMQRFSSHRKNCGSNKKLKEYLKLNRKNFDFDVLDVVSNEDSVFWETHYIFLYRSFGYNLLNQHLFSNAKFSKMNDSTKEKLSALKAGVKRGQRSSQTKEKQSLSMLGKNLGKRHTKTAIDKISVATAFGNNPRAISVKYDNKIYDCQTRLHQEKFPELSWSTFLRRLKKGKL